MHALRRTAIVGALVLSAAGVSTAPAFAGQVVQEPGFVSINGAGVAHALISHYDGNVGTITSGFATSGPGTVSAQMTDWGHEHGDPLFCVGPE